MQAPYSCECSASTKTMQRQPQRLRARAPFLGCRWRLFSLAQEDSMRSWKVEPFQLVEGAARRDFTLAHTCLKHRHSLLQPLLVVFS